MIRSMTAFARREIETGWGLLSLEIRTVNHRYCEVTLRLPEDMRVLEQKVRATIAKKIKRGKVDAIVRFHPVVNSDTGLEIDVNVARSVLDTINEIESMMENPSRVSSLDVLRWPGVINEASTNKDEMREKLVTLFDGSLEELVLQRCREGEKLREFVLQRCDLIDHEVDKVRQRMPEILVGQRKKIHDRLKEIQADLDIPRLEQEIAYIAQKIDIGEELDRITVHTDEVRNVLSQSEPIGRRLDFLMQELNREANTLGSKSIDTDTTKASVEMKVIIEQMREQVQNIE
ncbi:MAG: YicC/YloC family endoribonuclease [Gammaproteobacteria bacterium]